MEKIGININFKTAIVIGTLLFAIAGFYYTTKNDTYLLSLQIKGLQTENRDIRKRLDATDKKLSRINKKLREIKNK